MRQQYFNNQGLSPFHRDASVQAHFVLDCGVESLHGVVGVGEPALGIVIEGPQPFYIPVEARPCASQTLMGVETFAIVVLALLPEIGTPSLFPLAQSAHEALLVGVAHQAGYGQQLLRRLALGMIGKLDAHVLSGMELAELETVFLKAVSQSFKAIAHDAQNDQAQTFDVVYTLLVVTKALFVINELVPHHTAAYVVLDDHHAEIAPPSR